MKLQRYISARRQITQSHIAHHMKRKEKLFNEIKEECETSHPSISSIESALKRLRESENAIQADNDELNLLMELEELMRQEV